jgi:hypothetical protein
MNIGEVISSLGSLFYTVHFLNMKNIPSYSPPPPPPMKPKYNLKLHLQINQNFTGGGIAYSKIKKKSF